MVLTTNNAATTSALRERLLSACRRGYLGAVRALVSEKRIKTNRAVLAEALLEASAHGRVDIVTELLMNGISHDSTSPTTGHTLLHCAAKGGHYDMVTFLVSSSARDQAQFARQADRKKRIRKATALGHLTWGIDDQDQQKRTPLLLAAWSGHVGIARLLLEHGADPNVQDARGWNALIGAAAFSLLQTVNLLLSWHTCQVSTQSDRTGNSALFEASRRGYVDVVHALLKGGVDPKLVNMKGENALAEAVSHGHSAVASLIMAALTRQGITFDKHQSRYKASTIPLLDGVSLLNSWGKSATTMARQQHANPNLKDCVLSSTFTIYSANRYAPPS